MRMVMMYSRSSSSSPSLRVLVPVILLLSLELCHGAHLKGLKGKNGGGDADNTTAASSDAVTMLRGGTTNPDSRPRRVLGSKLLPIEGGGPTIRSGNGSGSGGDGQDEVVRVMVNCNDITKEGRYACKNRILSSVPPKTVRIIHYLKISHAYSVSVKMSYLGELEGIEDDPPRTTMHIPDSIQVMHPRELQQSGDQTTPYGITMVKAPKVWDQFQTKGDDVRVCVLDTGVDRTHEDLDQLTGYEGNDLVQPWYRDAEGHGTHVTGTISADDNTLGVVGVAPNVEIFMVRVFTADGQFYSSDMIAALEACREGGAQVVSMSLGGPGSNVNEQSTLQSFHEVDGIVTVAAAGNSGGTELLYPAAYDYVLSVAAVDRYGRRPSFSTSNGKVDVAAPGVGIISTWPGGNYASLDGTSMSCPHVSGVVALMKSAVPTATPANIFAALTSSADNPNTSPGERDNYLGYGIVNALAAVTALSNNSSNTGGGGGTGGGDGTGTGTGTTVPGDGTGSGSGNGGGSGGTDDTTCVPLLVTLHTDRYGSDTTQWLESSLSSTYLFYQDNFDSFATYQESLCVDPTGCYLYNILDAYGDGIAGEGVEVQYNNEIVYAGGNFGTGGVLPMGTGCPSS